MDQRQQILMGVLGVSTFVLVLAVWVFGMLLWTARRSSRSQKVHRRLGLSRTATGERTLHLWLEGRELTTTVPTMSRAGGMLERLEYQFHQAGWIMSIGQILTLLVGIVVITSAFMM